MGSTCNGIDIDIIIRLVAWTYPRGMAVGWVLERVLQVDISFLKVNEVKDSKQIKS